MRRLYRTFSNELISEATIVLAWISLGIFLERIAFFLERAS